MQSESAIENRATERGRRKKRGNGAADGPVFVDNSGRRSRLLRRIGTLVGVVCLGYAVVLGMAFMGWGISVTPSSLLPFGGGQAAGAPGGGGSGQLPGGVAPTGTPPTGAPPTGAAPSPSASVSTGAN
ncbi:hypothetical protein [Streptomyces sp. NBC_00564]|uniref:hypothetical protein n=1 Tax=Streptomyces sp. NBC_00564 TaxID=2903663 RepID=UPI00352D6FD3|nr:hypothetical protein OG256_26770 [Streptomyces sp. NBC_00564]